MIRSEDIGSMTDFKRQTESYLRKLKKTGRPRLLTINGRAAAVVLDPAAYDRILDALENAESIASIRRGLAEIERGEGVVAREAFPKARSRRKAS